jgi:methylated-DNA-protein-cysteine methyltransferase-like protein
VYSRIYAVIAMIPEGRVATYGQVAMLAGLPGHARQVGYALAASGGIEGLPWHRVINARGEISPRGRGDADQRQRILLINEGVEFDSYGRAALARFRWRPEVDGRRPGAAADPGTRNDAT